MPKAGEASDAPLTSAIDRLRDNLLNLHKQLEILLIEDDQNDEFLFTRAVESCEAHMTVARSLGTALLALELKQFDIVFLDLRLGVDNGLDIVNVPKCPVVIVTGLGEQDMRVLEALKLGASCVLSKPVLPEKLKWLLNGIGGITNE